MTHPTDVLCGRWTRARPFESDDDLVFVYRMLIDPITGQSFQFAGSTPPFEEYCRVAWQDVLAQWIVEGRDSAQRIAHVALSSPDFMSGFAYLSIVAPVKAHRSPLPLDGCAAVIDYAFDTWSFRKLCLDVIDDDLKQFGKIIDRVATVEGRRTNHLFRRGRFQDVHLLSIERDRWLQQIRPRLVHRARSLPGSGGSNGLIEPMSD